MKKYKIAAILAEEIKISTHSQKCECRLPRLLTQQGLTTIERVDDAG